MKEAARKHVEAKLEKAMGYVRANSESHRHVLLWVCGCGMYSTRYPGPSL